MANKIIGIVGYKASDGNSFGAGISYLDMLSKYGDVEIVMPHTEYHKLDLLFIPGGLDTNPTNYGEIPSFRTSNSDVFKEFFFKERLKNYIGNTPIWGCCLGLQMLAVFFGCKLTQHLNWHPQSDARWKPAHKIWVVPTLKGKPFFNDGIKAKPIEVNSFHHQAVIKSGFNYNELIPMAYAVNEDNPKDDIIEAFVHKEYKIFACQDHPEDLMNDFHKAAVNWLLT